MRPVWDGGYTYSRGSVMKHKRITKAQEYLLIEKYQKEGCLASRDILIDSQIGVLTLMARKMSWDTEQQKDLIQEGVIAALECLPAFDTRKGYRLSTLVGKSAFFRMRRYNIDTFDVLRGHITLDQDENFMDEYISETPCFVNGLINQDLFNAVDVHLDTLTRYQRDCFKIRCTGEKKGRDRIAKEYGTSTSNVSCNYRTVQKQLMKILCLS